MTSVELKKIDFYMYLWEMYNRNYTIEDFENKINSFLDTKSRKIDDEQLGSIYIPILKDFFLAHNIELHSTTDSLFEEKRILDTSSNIFIDFLMKRITSLTKVFFEVAGKEDIKEVREETVTDFFKLFESSKLDKKDVIEIIKSGIRGSLKLSNKDAIFLVNNKIIIRHFTETSAGAAKRFGGIPAFELEKIYKQRSEDHYNQISKAVVEEVIEGELNLKKINNVNFHKTYIKTAQRTLSDHLLEDFMENPSLLPAFTNYVFRIFFDKILMGIVEAMVDLLANGNANITNFIGFYDGKELYLDQEVIQKPKIMIGEESWNYQSIMAVVNDWKKAKAVYDKESIELNRVQFLVQKMQESREKLEKKKAEMDSMPNDFSEDKEYKNIVFDLEISEKEIARRGEKVAELEIAVAPFRQEMERYEEKLFEIKKAIVATISNFRF